jgi:hypothetical protein
MWRRKQHIIGRVEPGQPGHDIASVNVIGARSSLAEAATASKRQTAASAAASAAAAAAAAAAATAASAASTSPAASAASGKFFPKSGRSGVFLVEDVERPQADVGDFFLTESDLGRGGIPRRYFRGRHSGCGGCAARQRQRHADDSRYRYDFLWIFSLRNTLRLRHSRILPRLLANVRRPERLLVRPDHASGKADYACRSA